MLFHLLKVHALSTSAEKINNPSLLQLRFVNYKHSFFFLRYVMN